MCRLTQRCLGVGVSFCLIWAGAIKECTCCADALCIMAGSAPNATFVTVTDSIGGKEGGGSPPPQPRTTCQSQQAHNRCIKDVRFINSMVAYSLAPLGQNFERVTVSLIWVERFLSESSLMYRCYLQSDLFSGVLLVNFRFSSWPRVLFSTWLNLLLVSVLNPLVWNHLFYTFHMYCITTHVMSLC